MEKEYKLGSIVVMKKQHPCGENKWEITRIGADIKIKCLKCGRSIMLPRIDFNKKFVGGIYVTKKKEEKNIIWTCYYYLNYDFCYNVSKFNNV